MLQPVNGIVQTIRSFTKYRRFSTLLGVELQLACLLNLLCGFLCVNDIPHSATGTVAMRNYGGAEVCQNRACRPGTSMKNSGLGKGNQTKTHWPDLLKGLKRRLATMTSLGLTVLTD